MSLIYFDNAATTFKKPSILHDFMYDYYQANSISIDRGFGGAVSGVNNIVKDTRSLLKELFHANIEYEAILTATATEAINIILQGLDWRENDVVYISPFEHNAVYRVVKYLEKIKKIQVQILEVDKQTLELNLESIRAQFIIKRPKMVVVTHVSNVCGNILDINSLGKLVKDFGAKYLVDCAQSTGLLETDVMNCCADYMVFAGHKTLYGPTGCSGFLCKKISAIKPLLFGGTGIDSASEDMPNELPTRYEPGTRNILSIAGLNASLRWIKEIGINKIRAKENENYNLLLDLLASYDFIEIIGKGTSSTSIVSCRFKGLSPDNVGQVLAEQGVVVRTGLQCAPLAHKFLGTFPEGTVRFSVSYFTDAKDYETLRMSLENIKGEL